MAAKLGRLAHTTQEALGLLACLGNVAEIATLDLVSGRTKSAVHTALWQAARAGLVHINNGAYAFIHDRVQEAAYGLIPESERAMAHLRIGRLLASRTTPQEREEKIFVIVNQLDRGAALITEPKEREQIAELNLIAGRRAKTATAYAAALQYCSVGRGLLGEDGWELNYRLVFDLELNWAECEYLTGNLASAEERLSVLSVRALSILDSASVACVRLNLYTHLDHSDSAVAVGLNYLRRFDRQWPSQATVEDVRREYDRLWRALGDRSIEALLDLPRMIDPDRCATMDVLTALVSPALFTDENLFRLVIGRMATLSLEHGNSDGSCLAYAWLGGVVGRYFGDYQAGFRLGKLGLDLVEKRGFDRLSARVYLVFAVHVAHWTQPLTASRVFLRRAFDEAQRTGDLTYAAYSRADLNTNLLASGHPLGEVEREVENALAFVGEVRFGLITDLITAQQRLIKMLRGLTRDFNSFNDSEFDESRFEQHLDDNPRLAISAARYWIRKLQACVHAGNGASAVAAALKAESTALDRADTSRAARIPFLWGTWSGGPLRYGLGRGAASASGGAAIASQANTGLGRQLSCNVRKSGSVGWRRARASRKGGNWTPSASTKRPSGQPASMALSRTRGSPANWPRISTRRAALRRFPTLICGTLDPAIFSGGPTEKFVKWTKPTLIYGSSRRRRSPPPRSTRRSSRWTSGRLSRRRKRYPARSFSSASSKP